MCWRKSFSLAVYTVRVRLSTEDETSFAMVKTATQEDVNSEVSPAGWGLWMDQFLIPIKVVATAPTTSTHPGIVLGIRLFSAA